MKCIERGLCKVPTKSKLDKSMPNVREVAFFHPSIGKNYTSLNCGGTRGWTGWNGTTGWKIRIKQPTGTKYPYQVQYQCFLRPNGTNRFSQAENPSANTWKSAKAGTSNTPAQNAITDPNTWLKANLGKRSTDWSMIDNFMTGNQSWGSGYDAKKICLRIRTYDNSRHRHGDWQYFELHCFLTPSMKTDNVILSYNIDGGLSIKFDVKYPRNLYLQLTGVIKGGRNLLNKATVDKGLTVAATQRTTGYSTLIATIAGSELKTGVSPSDSITITGLLKDKDGGSIDSSFTITGTVSAITWTTTPTVDTLTYNETTGVVQFVVQNGQAIEQCWAMARYFYKNKFYDIQPSAKTINLGSGQKSYFEFVAPIGIQLQMVYNCAKTFEGVRCVHPQALYVPITMSCKGYRLNPTDSSFRDVAILWGEPVFTQNTEPQLETALPFGRASNIAFFGSGNTRTITLSGTIVDKPDCYGGTSARLDAWRDVKFNTNRLYTFRTNRGDLYKVAIRSIDFSHDKKDLYTVNVRMTEVE